MIFRDINFPWNVKLMISDSCSVIKVPIKVFGIYLANECKNINKCVMG